MLAWAGTSPGRRRLRCRCRHAIVVAAVGLELLRGVVSTRCGVGRREERSEAGRPWGSWGALEGETRGNNMKAGQPKQTLSQWARAVAWLPSAVGQPNQPAMALGGPSTSNWQPAGVLPVVRVAGKCPCREVRLRRHWAFIQCYVRGLRCRHGACWETGWEKHGIKSINDGKREDALALPGHHGGLHVVWLISMRLCPCLICQVIAWPSPAGYS